MNAEQFAFFRWANITQNFLVNDPTVGWGCQDCRDGWIALQRESGQP